MNFLESLRIIFVIFGSPMHFKACKKSTNFGVLVGVLDVMVGVLGVLIGILDVLVGIVGVLGVLIGILDVLVGIVGVVGVLIGGFPESSLNVLYMFSGCSLSAPVSALY